LFFEKRHPKQKYWCMSNVKHFDSPKTLGWLRHWLLVHMYLHKLSYAIVRKSGNFFVCFVFAYDYRRKTFIWNLSLIFYKICFIGVDVQKLWTSFVVSNRWQNVVVNQTCACRVIRMTELFCAFLYFIRKRWVLFSITIFNDVPVSNSVLPKYKGGTWPDVQALCDPNGPRPCCNDLQDGNCSRPLDDSCDCKK